MLSGDINAVRAHIAEIIDLEMFSLSVAKVISREIVNDCQQKLMDSRGKLKISAALKNSFISSLIIPGSSIKEAIRNAVLGMLDREHNLWFKKTTQMDIDTCSKNRNYEDKLKLAFGDITNNTFKKLKISDFEATSGAAAFVSAREVGRKADKKPTPKNSCEGLPGMCMDDGVLTLAGKLGVGAVTADDPAEDLLEISFAGNKVSLSREKLAALCSAFYRKRYLDEKQKFYTFRILVKRPGQWEK